MLFDFIKLNTFIIFCLFVNDLKVSDYFIVKTIAGKKCYISGINIKNDFKLLDPHGVCIDGFGNIYICEVTGNTVKKMSPDGELVWTAGRAGERGAQDGEGGTARFNRPNGLAVDEQGEVYVADFGNHLIRKVSPEGRVSTLAGEAGVAGAEDGVGARAHFQHPHGLAVDRNGNVYVADAMNHTVRKITPQGQVSTLAGAPGRPGIADGDRATGRLNAPYGVAVDPAGWVYVVERDGHTVRKISPEGWIMNLAGKACVSGSADGNGAEARFWSPRGIAIDRRGNLYVADSANCAIRMISPGGNVSTLAGTPGVYGEEDGPSKAARFNYPHGVAIDSHGRIYVADSGNNAVRRIQPARQRR